jgi:hypothetical protein
MRQKNTSILLKKIIAGMGWGYSNPSEKGMRFDFLSPLDMGRVAGKYMVVGYVDGEGKTCPHPSHCHA